MQKPFLAEAGRRQEEAGLCLVVKSNYRYIFNPPSEQAIGDLERFADVHDWTSLTVVALPYVGWPEGMNDVLELLAANGAQVIRPQLGQGDWPPRLVGQRAEDDFTNDVRLALFQELGWQVTASPAERFRRSAEKLADYIIVGAALDRCDEVHTSRHPFLKRSAEMLDKFCRKKGRLGMTLEDYCRDKRIGVAHSGGISTCIRLMKGVKQLERFDSNLHLKEGDGTSETAAARIYFQHLDRNEQFRLFLLYAGPHPSADIDQKVDWLHD
ncbi:hypothetical protein ABB34_08080 [Stenotrophomonas daejeonensis]|uniref:Uncharacterized protein n=1 Tax=Stenotrophomonas daejeonensis TaxID=659018 RepID=A0A0R0E5Q4_9GAMM|nr:hypothetical protein ABB34_08080 [Stenotrophomonas daejeonensis]